MNQRESDSIEPAGAPGSGPAASEPERSVPQPASDPRGSKPAISESPISQSPISQPPVSAPPPPADTTPLLDYFRANRDAYTEDALRHAALVAGNAPADVEAAIVATRPSPAAPVDRGIAVRNVFLWYLGVFSVLTVLMLINPSNANSGGFFGDVRPLGVTILAGSLGLAFIASLVWIASRRVFIALVGVYVVFTGVTMVNSSAALNMLSGAVFLGIGFVIIVAAWKVGARPGVPAAPSTSLLMLVPMLMLLAVGGMCVASGLPLPRA
jgi:hypothetical protein